MKLTKVVVFSITGGVVLLNPFLIKLSLLSDGSSSDIKILASLFVLASFLFASVLFGLWDPVFNEEVVEK